METYGEQQEANLISFLHSFFVPAKLALQLADWRKSPTEARYARGSMLEVVGWLYLGAQAQYFDSRRCGEVFVDIFPLYTNSESLLAEKGDLFSEDMLRIFRLASDKRDIFSTAANANPFHSLERIQPALQTILMLQRSYVLDAVAQSFAMTVSFGNEREWEHLMSDELSSEGLIYLLTHQPEFPVVPTKETVYAGFYRTIDYMLSFLEFFHDLQERSKAEDLSKDSTILESWVKAIVRWRLNFDIGDAEVRFLRIAEDLESRMMNEIKLQELQSQFEFNKGGFVALAKQLLNGWNGRLTIGVGGGGFTK